MLLLFKDWLRLDGMLFLLVVTLDVDSGGGGGGCSGDMEDGDGVDEFDS